MDVVSIGWVVIVVIAVQLHEFGIGSHRATRISQGIPGRITFHVVDAKRRLADTSPRVMLRLPCLPAEKRLASTRLLALACLKILAEIGPHQIVVGTDVELVEEKADCPWCVLHVKDTQHRFCSPRRMADLSQTVEIIYFLRCHLAGALFAVFPLDIVDE